MERKKCEYCHRELPRDALHKSRIRYNRYFCVTCVPSHKGRTSKRELGSRKEFECITCHRSYSPDYYNIRVQAGTGTKVVYKECRRCIRERKWLDRYGYTEEEARLRSDVIYDFRLARTVFGMTNEEAKKWILNGYRTSGLTETDLSQWELEKEAAQVWEPDPLSTESAQD